MSTITISNLPAAGALTGAEVLPIVQSGTTSQTTTQDIANLAGGGGAYLYIGNSSATSSVDWSQANVQELNLDSNPTLTFNNGVLGQTSTLLLKQVQAGQKSITWPNNVKWSGNTAPSLVSVPGPGAIDLTFDIGTAFNGTVNVIKVQPDGKILVGGAFTTYKGAAAQCLIRLNTDGSKDTSFSTQTWYSQSGTPEIFAIELLPDGSILVGGNIGGQFSFMGRKWLQKVNADGTWNGSWDANLNNIVYAIKRQSDDKIVLGGDFSNIGGNYAPFIGRINSDASYDNTFTPVVNNTVRVIEIQPDGKILIGGTFTSIGPMGSSISVYGIARLLTNGSYDSSFDTGTKLTYSMGGPGSVYSMILQSDGKVIIGGQLYQYNGTNTNGMLRLNSDATLDTNFNTNTSGPNGFVSTFSVLPNDKLFIGGDFNSFQTSPGVYVTCNKIALVNITNASFDPSFTTGAGSGANNSVIASAVQLDNKLLIGGTFTTVSSTSTNRIARLNTAASGDAYYNKVTFDYNGLNYIGSF